MATVIDIERTRGDTQRIILKITDDATGLPADISSWSDFKLTVDPSKDPEDGTTKVEEMTGALAGAGTDGRVYFIPSGATAAGKYYYDAQALDANAEKYTFAKGKYVLIQDITKT